MGKMSRISLVCAIGLLIIVGTPFSALAGEKPPGKPFEAIWEELDELQEQIDDLQTQINDLQAKLDAEEAARIAADSDLQDQLDAMQVQINDLQAQIDAERAARIEADSDLQSQIDTERTDRMDTDSDLQFQIDNHKHAGEDIVSGKIDNARLNTGHGNGLDADMVDGEHASGSDCLWSESSNGIYYDEGYVGIGTSEPHGLLHVAGSVGGFMYWDSDSVDDTIITIIPDGPQDVEYAVSYTVFIKEKSKSNWNGVITSISRDHTTYLWKDGTNVVALNCTADGALTIYRESGTSTFEVALKLFWV